MKTFNLRRKTILLVASICLLSFAKAKAGLMVVGELAHEQNVVPGKRYGGVILLRNPGAEPQEAEVYQTDYQFFLDGRVIYGEPGKIPRSNAHWITFSPKRLTIPPGEEVTVHYTVSVPPESALVGTYWSILMVQETPKTSPQAPMKNAGLDINTIMRYGIQIATQIGDTGLRQLKFSETKLLKEKHRKILQVDIENTGERWLQPLSWVELYDEKGSSIGRYEGRRTRTYPGTSVRHRIDLTDLPEGRYKALVVADCGGNDLFGATYTLKFEK